MKNFWRWASARSTGTSHSKSGLPCQDFALCKEFDSPEGNVFACVVSDGAGSASHAAFGAKMVCTGFLRAARDYLITGREIEDINEDDVLDWLDGIREQINTFAKRNSIRPRDCAATLVGAMVGPRSAFVAHIGDGAAVVREEGSSDWIVPSWPFHGEYASMTTFVTDDPVPKLSIVKLPIRLDRIAIFSDGIERMVLDHSARTAYGPFFDKMTEPVSTTFGSLSRPLRDYLDSKAVCDRTDDDKTLILGVRL